MNRMVYIQDDDYGTKEELCEAETLEEAVAVIEDVLSEMHYTATYWRHWTSNSGAVWFDIGSHKYFFVWDE